MQFLTFIGGVILFFMVVSLKSRVQKLERLVSSSESKFTPSESYQPQQQPQSQPHQQGTQPTPRSNPLFDYIKDQLKEGSDKKAITNALLAKGWKSSEVENAFNSINPSSPSVSLPLSEVTAVQAQPTLPSSSDKFVEWLREDWLLKLGALLLLIGFGWLTSYAFLNNWISSMGRIILGIAAGAAFMVLGYWRIKKYIHQGGIFLVLGSTTILLTIFAAREIYGFFTPLSALVLMFLSTAFVAFASVKYKSNSLALTSLILAGIAPLFTNSPVPDYVGLFVYLLVVILGAIWIVALTGKRELTAAALTVVIFYSLPHLFGLVSAETGWLLLVVYAFTIVFFITNTLGILKLKAEEITSDLIIAAGNGLFLLAWILVAAPQDWKSLIILAWMFIFLGGAFLIFRTTQRREPFYVYAGVGIVMLGAATSVQMHGSTLVIAYILECVVISLIAYFNIKNIKAVQRINLLFIVPILLSLQSMDSIFSGGDDIHKDFFVLLILSLSLLGLGSLFLRPAREAKEKEPKQLNTVMIVTGIVMLGAATAVELSGASLVIAYTLLGAVISLIAFYILKDIKATERINLLLFVPALLSIQSMRAHTWGSTVIQKDFFALLILALTLFGLGWFFVHHVRESEEKESKQINAGLFVVGSLYLYRLLWLSEHAALSNQDVAVMICLVVYIIVGLITYFYGLLNEKKGLRLYGAILLGSTVGRLLLVDVWGMDLTGRIITFFLIGALLVSTAFLGKKKRLSNITE